MSRQSPLEGSSTSWRGAFAAVLVGVLTLMAVYWSTAQSLAQSWARDPLGHGYLVVPAALYLAWTRRDELMRLPPSPTLWPVPVALLLAFAWLVGRLTGTDVVQYTSLVGLVVTVVWAVLGTAAVRTLSFALGFLLFALPLADRFVPGLQDVAARFAVTLLSASGVPVLLQGHVISIPGATWEVAKACSGINYLTASLALGYVYAGLTYKTWRNRLLFMLAAALIPLVANGVRVYGTILLAFYGATGIVEGTQHYLFGWLVFAAMMAVLLWVCGGWADDPSKTTAKGAFGPARISSLPAAAVLGAVLLAGAATPASGLRYLQGSSVAVGDADLVPTVLAPWQPSADDPYRWQPSFSGDVGQFARTYRSGSRAVRLHIASYSSAQAGVNLVSAGNLLSERPWTVTATRSVPSSVSGIVLVRETALSGDGEELRVWSWYTVGEVSTGSDYRAKLLLAKAQLLRQPLTSRHVTVATTERALDGRTANEVLADFLAHLQWAPSSRSARSGDEFMRVAEGHLVGPLVRNQQGTHE